jgi:HAD superfamily hydrolase (TIGR01549 family)
MRALLFDLDGTLTKGGGAGSRALGKALHAKPRAVEELRAMRLDGMTDRAIARALLAAEHDAQVPFQERLQQIREDEIDHTLHHYLLNLEAACAEKPYEPLPGVRELLLRLTSKSLLGLCTGNVERGAEIKLRSAGLWGAFQFGGYGSDAEPRAEIVRIAWARAQKLGAREALVIGDTPRDILAARDAGLCVCAVATGRWSVKELAEHGPDIIVADFSDLEASERLLLGALH